MTIDLINHIANAHQHLEALANLAVEAKNIVGSAVQDTQDVKLQGTLPIDSYCWHSWAF